MEALCDLEPCRAGEFLTEALHERDLRRRGLWIWWMCARKGYRLTTDVCLMGFGRDVQPLSRALAGQMLLKHGEGGRRKLIELLRSELPDRRATAALALARSTHEGVFEILITELVDGYYAEGWLGQYLVVIPATRTVAVRMREFKQIDVDRTKGEQFAYRGFVQDVTALAASPDNER